MDARPYVAESCPLASQPSDKCTNRGARQFLKKGPASYFSSVFQGSVPRPVRLGASWRAIFEFMIVTPGAHGGCFFNFCFSLFSWWCFWVVVAGCRRRSFQYCFSDSDVCACPCSSVFSASSCSLHVLVGNADGRCLALRSPGSGTTWRAPFRR